MKELTRRQQGAGHLRMLADSYFSLQRERLRNAGRRRAISAGEDASPYEPLWEQLEQRFTDMEGLVAHEFLAAVEMHPVGPWLLAVKGIGPILAGKLIGLIGDATEFGTVSKLWRYAGLAVVHTCVHGHVQQMGTKECPACGSTEFLGAAERRAKGQPLHYDMRLKSTLFNVAGAMLKATSPYRSIYDAAYLFYMTERPTWSGCAACGTSIAACMDKEKHRSLAARSAKKGWNTGHVHLAATRKMNKVFLSHLWEAWHRLEGKAVPQGVYVADRLGHEHILRPEQFCDFPLPVVEA